MALKVFTSGEVLFASDLNENFDELESNINSLEAQVQAAASVNDAIVFAIALGG
jgi:hypothetical protein